MMEVLKKSFWRGVTKTFYEALENPPPKSDSLPQPAPAGEVRPSPAPEKSSEESKPGE